MNELGTDENVDQDEDGKDDEEEEEDRVRLTINGMSQERTKRMKRRTEQQMESIPGQTFLFFALKFEKMKAKGSWMDETNDLASKEGSFCIGFDAGLVFFFIAESNDF